MGLRCASAAALSSVRLPPTLSASTIGTLDSNLVFCPNRKFAVCKSAGVLVVLAAFGDESTLGIKSCSALGRVYLGKDRCGTALKCYFSFQKPREPQYLNNTTRFTRTVAATAPEKSNPKKKGKKKDKKRYTSEHRKQRTQIVFLVGLSPLTE